MMCVCCVVCWQLERDDAQRVRATRQETELEKVRDRQTLTEENLNLHGDKYSSNCTAAAIVLCYSRAASF